MPNYLNYVKEKIQQLEQCKYENTPVLPQRYYNYKKRIKFLKRYKERLQNFDTTHLNYHQKRDHQFQLNATTKRIATLKHKALACRSIARRAFKKHQSKI